MSFLASRAFGNVLTVVQSLSRLRARSPTRRSTRQQSRRSRYPATLRRSRLRVTAASAYRTRRFRTLRRLPTRRSCAPLVLRVRLRPQVGRRLRLTTIDFLKPSRSRRRCPKSLAGKASRCPTWARPSPSPGATACGKRSRRSKADAPAYPSHIPSVALDVFSGLVAAVAFLLASSRTRVRLGLSSRFPHRAA